MIISSIILLISSLSLFVFPIQCFYIINAAVLEQCSTGEIIYSNKFDPNKLHCLNNIWRQVFIAFEYSCTNNKLMRIWTMTTNVNQGAKWPSEIFILTGRDYTKFDQTSSKKDLTIEDDSITFDPNNNQLIAYMWTSLPNGPQCRIKYSIIKDICTANKGSVGAKLTDFVCYYGKQTFNLITVENRHALDKLLDDGITGSINILQNNAFNINHNNHSVLDSELSALEHNVVEALNAGKNSLWQKFKRHIIIGGSIVVVIILIIVVLIIVCCCRSSKNDADNRMSDDSNIE